MTGYYVGTGSERDVRNERDFELTERELECLYWIAEGKTSDEIAMILGISAQYHQQLHYQCHAKNRDENAFGSDCLCRSAQSGVRSNMAQTDLRSTQF